MTRKKSLFITLSLTALVIFFGCTEGGDSGKGTLPSQPGSGPDTLIAIFTDDAVTGSVRLTPSAMSYLRGGQSGSGSDTLRLYMTMKVCQPGSSSDTCFEIISASIR
jgi:hypothetical protein